MSSEHLPLRYVSMAWCALSVLVQASLTAVATALKDVSKSAQVSTFHASSIVCAARFDTQITLEQLLFRCRGS